jgi:hypothetical protein
MIDPSKTVHVHEHVNVHVFEMPICLGIRLLIEWRASSIDVYVDVDVLVDVDGFEVLFTPLN